MKTNFLSLLILLAIFQVCHLQSLTAQTEGVESGAIYKLRSNSSNKLLNVSNSAMNNGRNVDTWTDTDSDAERWKLEHLGNNIYTLQNIGTNKFLHIANTTPASSVNVDQNENTNNNTVRWNIVNNGDGSFTLHPADNGSLSLDLSGGGNFDGANVQLWTNNNLNPQKWTFEKVSSRAPAPTASIADQVFEAWSNEYNIVNSSGFWGTAEEMEVVVDAYEVTGHAKYRNMFNEMYDKFIAREGDDWMWNNYNDDIAWISIACVRSYLLTGNTTHLNKAKDQFDKMYARALTDSYGGGLLWYMGKTTKNSCINGPAMVACCYLAQATGDNSYYNKAIDLYNWSKIYLFDENTGKVNDNYDGTTGTWSSTYNQGTYLGASVMLYNYTKDPQYLTFADRIAQYTKVNMYNSGVMNNEEGGNDLPGFKGIFMRYARRYVVDGNRPDYIPWLQLNAKVAYNNRNSKNITLTNWGTRTPETINCDCSQEFSTSTVASLMMNCPKSTSITKNAFNTIEAESFDYLKGIIVETCPDGTDNLGGILNGYYTAYNNVNFGSTGAIQAEFRVSSGTNGGIVEIRLDGVNGQLIGTANIASTGGWATYATVTCDVNYVTGLQNVYLVFKGDGYLFNFNHFKFIEGQQNKIATLFKDCAFSGTQVGLNEGDYTLANLQANGILDNDISSLKVTEGYIITLYDGDNFSGNSIEIEADNDCLVDEGWNDIVTSLRIKLKGTTGVSGLNGNYIIQNRNSGLVMDVANGTPDNGTNILQWNNTGATNQQFILNEVATGIYSIINVATSKCVDIEAVSTANGANVHQWDYVGGGNQQFQIESSGNGYYKLRATHSNKIIEVANASLDADANIIQYDDNNQLCGQWKLIAVTDEAWSTLIEAESYSSMAGVDVETCSEGGQNVGWIDAGDWMVWDIDIPSSGTYTVEYRIASPDGVGSIQLEKAGGSPVYGNISVPATGGWQNWQTISHSVNLEAGAQQVAIYVPMGGYNINWIQISQGLKSAADAEINSFKEKLDITIYPNPVNNLLNISCISIDVNIQIYTLSGHKIIETNETKIDLSHLVPGIYLIKTSTTNEKLDTQLLIKK